MPVTLETKLSPMIDQSIKKPMDRNKVVVRRISQGTVQHSI